MEISFTKMHGLGNDFVLINCIEQPEVTGLELEDLSKTLCHRRFGIGADQILLLCPSEIADFKMKIYNADGGEVEMCGNGIRCFAKYIWDRGLSKKDILEIETLAGIIKPERAGDMAQNMVKVDMGEPILEPEKIPVNIKSSPPIIDYPLQIKDRNFKITCVSMGNPHAVIFLDEDLSNFPVSMYGPLIEKHPLFSKRTNVEFVTAQSKTKLSMRVWERGSGETMACGTGASATGVAAMLKGLTERSVYVQLLGGDLLIEWNTNNHVYMTGPAVEVFHGRIDVNLTTKSQ
jgi:diaminopimelate epimerase